VPHQPSAAVPTTSSENPTKLAAATPTLAPAPKPACLATQLFLAIPAPMPTATSAQHTWNANQPMTRAAHHALVLKHFVRYRFRFNLRFIIFFFTPHLDIMNNLGLSSNGNPFQLVPPTQQNNLIRNYKSQTRPMGSSLNSNLKLKNNDPLKAFLDGDVQGLQNSLQQNRVIAQPEAPSQEITELKQLLEQMKASKNPPVEEKPVEEASPQEARNRQFMNSIQQNIQQESTPLPNIATGKSNEWTKIFQNVCLTRLQKNFVALKSAIQKISVFQNTSLCFINQDQMKRLVQHVKSTQDRPSYPVMSLRMYLTRYTENPFSLKDADELEKLVQTVELFGPPEHVLINLGSQEIKMLMKDKPAKYWPYGDEGITWVN
jgi:hypothetical protein